MTELHTHIEHVAFDLGMQIIARHGLQVKLNEAQGRIDYLEARLQNSGVEAQTAPGADLGQVADGAIHPPA